ncbi:succinate dehydrogenase hydrophobic membrane anchor subunit [Thermorudis peleae]|uniref:succinate dehydrogenase hydrophobic membrane anchor subunit n=1 Tax=Thermorudis peleae TaxID=1382356 RepID=UPI00056F0FAE|nr:succinate dehydrogenase hydrophobic membrane anchor subunit [Thermorudis peleae]MBX6753803.1 succinate dehydrogenase hydrophobic membrane anchor subunit [Thermorudis peleae]
MSTPRPSVGRERPSGGFELYSWYFFRISGLLLIFLAITHVIIMHVINTVDRIDWNFVANRWHSPFWRGFDWLMLFLALLHGLNGARLAIDDYIRPRPWRIAAYSVLWTVAIIFLVIGSIAILTFNPEAFRQAAMGS